MPDPLTVVIAAGAAGGAAGKFVERVWESGEKWMASFFADHQIDIVQNARENSGAFLADLSKRVEALELDNPYNKDFFSKAFKEPSFSVLLQKAILNSAQTNRSEKHTLLAKLVADKILAANESVQSLASQMACDAIAFATVNQLKILGLYASIALVQPNLNPPTIVSEQNFLQICEDWLEERLTPFLETNLSQLDLDHLEALSCLNYLDFTSRSLEQRLAGWKYGDFIFTLEKLRSMSIGKQVIAYWEEKRLRSVSLTSVGQLVGIYMIDTLSKSNTNLASWGAA